MRRYILGLFMITMLSSGCLGWGLGVKGVKGDDNSRKNTIIGGALIEKASGIEKAEVKADMKAEVKATGADLSKNTSIGGNQAINTQGVDMKTLAYIIGAFITLLTTIFTVVLADQKILNMRMMRQLKDKDIIILDLANDQKEILLKIMPLFVLMHSESAYQVYAENKIAEIEEVEKKIKDEIDKKVKKKFNIFRRKSREV